MVTDYIGARNVLKHRLDAVFGEVFAELYEGRHAPKVFLGFPVTEPPFYAAVDEIAEAQASAAASMGHARIDFTLRVWLCAQHSSLEEASDDLLSYIDVVIASVLADQTLNGTVENAFPEVESAGTAADSSKRYIAAAQLAIRCTVWSVCPAALLQAVEDSNSAIGELDEG